MRRYFDHAPIDPPKLQFAIIPVVTPPTNAIMHGSLSAVMSGIADSDVLKQTRNDAVSALNDATSRLAKADQREAELNRREQEINARELALNAATRNVVDLAGRLSELYDRLEQLRADKLADDQEEQELETHIPGGELHELPAKPELELAPELEDDDEPNMLPPAPAPTRDPDEPPYRDPIEEM
jgi:hypothetical protein